MNKDIASSFVYNLYSTHLEHGEVSPIDAFIGETYLIDQYDEGLHHPLTLKRLKSKVIRFKRAAPLVDG